MLLILLEKYIIIVIERYEDIITNSKGVQMNWLKEEIRWLIAFIKNAITENEATVPNSIIE